MKILSLVCLIILFSVNLFAQIPTETLIEIVKAEDERRFDSTLEKLLDSKDENIRIRTALAIGRIGDERGLDSLIKLLFNDTEKVQTMSAFAIGEIESIKGADAILKVLVDVKNYESVRSRAIEAAGKIIAANPKEEKSKQLGIVILNTLRLESLKHPEIVFGYSAESEKIIELCLTAILRAKPENAETVVKDFINDPNPKVRQNAMNTLARLRTKNAEINKQVHQILLNDKDAICRANACRILGISEDKKFVADLLKVALNDTDSRVRVSAIRALGNFKEKEIGESLIKRGNILLKMFRVNKMELLEIATSLGRVLEKSNDEKAINFLEKLRIADNYNSSETEISFYKISPETYKVFSFSKAETKQPIITFAQTLGEMAKTENPKVKTNVQTTCEKFFDSYSNSKQLKLKPTNNIFISELLNSCSNLKTNNFSSVLYHFIQFHDVQIRATCASLLAEQTPSVENLKALDEAFSVSMKDKDSNDAQLAILDAIGKQKDIKDNKSLQLALTSEDILVRRKAVQVLKTVGVDASDKIGTVENSVFVAKDYATVINGREAFVSAYPDAIYQRAVLRKNGTVKAIFTTEKGNFTIDLTPEDAPLTVENFIRLARQNYFNGVTVHRVVPNFVMQDGDPRGDGNGGPGYSIRCEVNMLEYERGAVGMALSGKDTGGSQWFVTHSPQPHLDGGYTVFGKVNEKDMKIVDKIARGDKILKVVIVEVTKVKSKK
jgi:cyclophilin family peptidyl-prolyl cis-trans isomerase/HEAT repeat protein